MNNRAKVGAALVAACFLALPSVYWLGTNVLWLALTLGSVGLVLVLNSGNRSASAAAIGTGGPIDAPGGDGGDL
jgi:hypothetical protein